MAKKISGRLVALSTSAVATIYLAGALSTRQAADAAAGVQSPPIAPTQATATPAAAASSAPAVVVGASAPPATSAPATSTATATGTSIATATSAASGYADGTYAGTGTSRFGNVYVSVTVAGAQITNVQITRVTTSYPVSRIASLPAQVVQKQTASVNVVTGATYSSQAFKQAVQQALAQASVA